MAEQLATLDMLHPGQQAVVKRLTSTGLERRRMMDLGIVPGSLIRVEMLSPLGDPAAYLIRGAVVALRKSQARQIEVAIVAEPEQVDGVNNERQE
ncbi:MAG: FeoA family protein [Anaerolineae bacterium]